MGNFEVTAAQGPRAPSCGKHSSAILYKTPYSLYSENSKILMYCTFSSPDLNLHCRYMLELKDNTHIKYGGS